MKKIITAILVTAMVLSLGTVSAFAATITGTGNQTGEVKAQYVRGEHGTVYSIDITWGAMQFDYNANEKWNTETHKWESDNPEWTVKDSSNTITLANNSSVAVDATFAFAANENYNTVSGTFASESAVFTAAANKLAMPVAAEDTAATTHIVTLTLSGSVASTVATYTNVGTITISLASPQN